MNAWDVFWRPQITEEDIQHEITTFFMSRS